MPSSCATRPSVSASTPSDVSRPRAVATTSCWRAVSCLSRSALATLEALRRAQAVPDGAVERDMDAPGEPGHERGGAGDQADRHQDGGSVEAVDRVVDGNGARVELPLGEPPAGAEE